MQDKQVAQLENLGFSTTEIINSIGQSIHIDDSDKDDNWIHYVVRKQ